jgi:hypothetical protein
MHACMHTYIQYNTYIYTYIHAYWWAGLRRITGFEIPGPITQNWLWVLSVHSDHGWQSPFIALPPYLVNLVTYYRSCVYVLSAFSTLRRNHHWVIGYRFSGRSHTYIDTVGYIIVHIHTYIHTYIHAYIHAYIHTYIHTHIHTRAHKCTHIHIHIHKPTYTYRAYIHTFIQACIHGHGHGHGHGGFILATYSNTSIHAYMHTYRRLTF